VGPILNISKDANGAYNRNVTWGITKSVTNGPLVRYLLSGSTQVDYQVVVTKAESITNVKVTGSITIDNSGDQPAVGPTVTDVLDSQFSNLPCNVDMTNFAIIGVSASESGGYTCTLPDGPPAADLGTNTATVTYAGLDGTAIRRPSRPRRWWDSASPKPSRARTARRCPTSSTA
jgi:uncharacterized repeat protein (TIGR01451 family)